MSTENENQEIYLDLGFIGHSADKLKELYEGYSEEPNEYGKFLRFENTTELVVNKGVMVNTNCFTEEQFKEDLLCKLLFKLDGN